MCRTDSTVQKHFEQHIAVSGANPYVNPGSESSPSPLSTWETQQSAGKRNAQL